MSQLPTSSTAGRSPLTLAELRGLGVSRRELSSPRWQRLARGVHAASGLDPASPSLRCALAQRCTPGAVLGGWAALFLQGVTDLDGRTGPAARDLVPILVHVGPRGRTRPTGLIEVDRGVVGPADVIELTQAPGVRVAAAGPACLTIARRHGVEEGLVAADAAVRAGLTTPAELRARALALTGARGARAARRVADLVDGRSASPTESRYRFVWTELAGLPRPQVNVVVVNVAGVVLARADLLDPEAATLGEYDGRQHRALAQHTADNSREEALERANVVVTRATALDLWPQRRLLVRRLQAAHSDGLARDRSRDRWDWRRT